MSSIQEGLRAARAIRSQAQDELGFDGIYMPNKPPIDKIAAYAVIGMNCAQALDYVRFHHSNQFSKKEMEAWEKKNVVCVDLGDRKYHQISEGSATEWAVNRFSIKRSPGVVKLVELINHNNKTGKLKGAPGAVALLLRDFYETTDNTAYHVEVVRAAADVVQIFISYENGHRERTDSDPVDDRVQELLKMFEMGLDKPLTLGQYVYQMWMLGYSGDHIVTKLQWWVDGRLAREASLGLARRDFAKMKKEEFAIRGGMALVLRTDDYWLNKVVPKGVYDVRVIAKADGHIAISTNQLDVEALKNVLVGREPDRWYCQRESGAILNGSVQYTDVPATTFTVEEIKGLIQQHVRAKPRQQPRPPKQ